MLALLFGATSSLGLSLPVYQVVKSGATAPQAANLSAALNISPGLVPQVNGLLSFVNTNSYLRVPSAPVTNSSVINELLAVSKNPVPSIPLVFNAFDFGALSKLTVLNSNVAINIASNALIGAGLYPANAQPITGNDWLTAFYTNDLGQVISNSASLDTRFALRLATPNGYPLIGPGAHVQVTFDPAGNVSRLIYAARQLQPGPLVQIISTVEASNRLARMFPPNAQLTPPQLVYRSPAFTPPPSPCPQCPPTPWNPTNILPWYVAAGSLTRIDPATGLGETMHLRTQAVLATDDPQFAPNVTITLNGGPPTQVSATANVSGGQPPYIYLWAGSETSASTNVGPSITYTPRVRVPFPTLAATFSPSNSTIAIAWPAPSPGFVLQSAPDLQNGGWSPVTNSVTGTPDFYNVVVPALSNRFFRLILPNGLPHVESCSVTVMDANGTSSTFMLDVPVLSQPIPTKLTGPVTYGCESPYPYPAGYVYWDTIMAQQGGGVEGFTWAHSDSWPGDFIVPSPPGSLPAKPWIHGDADYANWGVDTANIVLYNGDGNYTGFAEMHPDAAVHDYPVSQLYSLSGILSHKITFCDGVPCPFDGGTYHVDYSGHWRSFGKCYNLDWLCFYACSMLTTNPDYPPWEPWKRWGPAFNGLHAMTGFFNPASSLEIQFFADFPYNMLVAENNYFPPLTVVTAWVDTAISDGAGIPAAIGPIGPEGVNNYYDYYWGRGAGVGPSIPAGLITGWWYIVGAQVVFNP
jgi:hypothetical protein